MVAWGRDGDRGGRKEECEQEKTPEGDAFVHYLDPGDGFMGLGICQKLSDCALSNWASYYIPIISYLCLNERQSPIVKQQPEPETPTEVSA